MQPIKIGKINRKALTVSSTQLVKITPQPQQLPLVIEPLVEGVELIAWVQNNRSLIATQLQKHGGILFRFRSDLNTFRQFVQVTANKLMPYQDGSSPRSFVQDNIYTSTDYPADQSIFLHSELSYANTYPLKIYFYCITPAASGGETPIADIRKVYQRISPQIRDYFIEKQIMYVRNFGNHLGISWQQAFQTSDQSVVEEYCRNNCIEFAWQGDRLRTQQIHPAIIRHPLTNELVWFNHAAFFHVSTLESNLRNTLLTDFSEDELPYNTFYGDGSPIEPETLAEIRTAYQQETIVFPWQAGDILLLDNLLTAHGRMPFVGSRRVVVAMAEPQKRFG